MVERKHTKQKILVTGGAGFIGSHLVRRLVARGDEVTVIDDNSRGSFANLKSTIQRIRLVQMDLRCEEGLDKVFKGQNVVFNLAALNTGVDYDLGRTQTMFEDNMLLQLIPIRVAGRTKTIRKFIQVSSASVYSREAMENQVPTPETADTSNPEPSKLGYAFAKKMGENLAYWYSENSHLKTVIARFINVYGENDNFDEKGHFIPVMIRKFLEAQQEVQVFGSGKQKRSFLYVEDAVEALLTLERKGKSGDVYNIDAGEEHSVKEVVDSIYQLLGQPQLKVQYDTTKPEGSQRRLLDSRKLKALGWSPQISFETGLKRTVEDIKKKLMS